MNEVQLEDCVKKLREYADDLYDSLRNYSFALNDLADMIERAIKEEKQ